MAKTKNPLVREINYILLAFLLTLIGILLYGLLFNVWIKTVETILIWAAYTYAGLIALRFIRWFINLFNT
jgi:hypothetical protein